VIRATLIRLLLAIALAVATGTHDTHAQIKECGGDCIAPSRGPAPSHHSNSKTLGYIAIGVGVAVLGWLIGTQINPGPPDLPPGPGAGLPPGPGPVGQISLPPAGQAQVTPPSPQGPGGKGGPGVQALRRGFDLPPPGVTAYVWNEAMFDIPSSVPERTLDAIAARHRMTRLETLTIRLTGRTLHRWRLDGGGTVPDMIRAMAREQAVAGGQPIYLFALAQETVAPLNSDQYAPEKLSLPEAHRLATGNRVLVAVIDSGVDASHPDLAGAITANFDAAVDDTAPHPHGTGMAGAIAAHRTMLGTAPRVGLLTVRAFGSKPGNAEGTTFNIIKGLDWAVEQGARVINMSFAGPADPRLRDALAKVSRKGIVLVAAAGNAGPRSPPLYPAADPNVIAVTATDIDDALFPGANRGSYIAVSAPGVDVLVPGTGGTYQFTTGTSVAAAQVSGVAALLIERNPSLTPSDIRRMLTRTAKAIAPKGSERDFGSGLVNAYQAVSSARPKSSELRP
jgi:subtilisin family serine protease